MKKAGLSALIIVALIGCRTNKNEQPVSDQKFTVSTAKVLSVKDNSGYEYSGTVEASQTIPLNFKIPGTVENIYVEVGDAVKKGQVLASIDKSDMQNLYNTMLVKYEQAKDAYDRLKSVYEAGSLPEIKWVGMKSDYEEAKTSLELTKNNLDKCTMTAPLDGIIGSRNIEPGQSSVNLLSAPIELVKIETVYVKISVPENEIIRIQKGQKASIIISALGDKQLEGTVSNISPVADAISRTYTVKMTVRNSALELKPGMVCDVTLNLNSKGTSLVVPYKAVVRDDDGKTYVYVVPAGKDRVTKRPVRVGRYVDSGIQVIEGLTEGQVVVNEGSEKLSDNSLIRL